MTNRDDDEPELAGYEPHGDRPLRSRHITTAMRVVVILGLVALVVPGILVTVTTASRTAHYSCAVYTEYLVPQAVGQATRFELFGPGGLGWNCYAILFGGDELLLRELGLIPAGPGIPREPREEI